MLAVVYKPPDPTEVKVMRIIILAFIEQKIYTVIGGSYNGIRMNRLKLAGGDVDRECIRKTKS